MNRRHFLSRVGLAAASVAAFPFVKFTGQQLRGDPTRLLMESWKSYFQLHKQMPTYMFVSADFLDDFRATMRPLQRFVERKASNTPNRFLFKNTIVVSRPDLYWGDIRFERA